MPFSSWFGVNCPCGLGSTTRPWLRLREWCEFLLRPCGLKNLFLLLSKLFYSWEAEPGLLYLEFDLPLAFWGFAGSPAALFGLSIP